MLALAVAVGSPGGLAVADTWDNGAASSLWSGVNNWADNSEPTSADPVIFPTPIPLGDSTIALSSGEQCLNLTFNDSYSLGGGNLQLFGAGGPISVASGKTATITSSLIGSVGLTKSGSGSLTLSPTGSNTFTGDVNITGNVSINKDSSLGNGANDVLLGAGAATGTLTALLSVTLGSGRTVSPGILGGTIVSASGTFFTFNGALGGGASNPLTVNGTGTTVFNAASTRGGSTTVTNGAARLGNGAGLGTGGITVSNNGALELSAGITTGVFTSLNHLGKLKSIGIGAAHNGTVNVGAAATVTIDSGDAANDTLTLVDIDGGSGSVAIAQGLGTTSLTGPGNSFAGQWVVSAGTLRLAHADAITTSSSPLTISSTGTVIAETTSNYPGGWTVNGLLRVQNAGGLGVGTSGLNVNSGGTLQIENVNSARNISLNNGGTVKGTGAASVTGTLTAATAAPAVTLATNVLADTMTVGNYTGGAGGTTTHIGGSGTVILPAASTYAGGWEVDSGTLRIDHSDALGTDTSPVLVDGGTLQIGGGAVLSRGVTLNNGSTLKGGPVDGFGNPGSMMGALSIVPGAQVNLAGAQTIAGGSLVIGSAVDGSLSGGGGGSNVTVSAGTVKLGVAGSTYAGGWVITGGAGLIINSDGQLGSPINTVTFTGASGQLQVDGPVTTSRQINLNGSAASTAAINVNDTLTLNTGLAGTAANNLSVIGVGTMVLNAASGWLGTLASVGGSATLRMNHNSAIGVTPLSVGGGGAVELGSGISLSQALALQNQGIVRGTNNSTYAGTITANASATDLHLRTGNDSLHVLNVNSYAGGSGSTTRINGSGMVSFPGANTYSGSYVVESGTLRLAHVNAIATAASPIVIGAGGTAIAATSSNYTGGWTLNGGLLRVQNASGLGTGTSTVALDAGDVLQVENVSLARAIRLDGGGTLAGTGTAGYINSGFPQVTNAATSVIMQAVSATDRLTIGSAIRSQTATPSSATILVNGAGRIVLSSGGTTATDIFGGSWSQTGGILQVGQSNGSAINALGFKNGDARLANSITVHGGILAVGALGSGTSTPAWLRANVTLNGGAIASTNGIDAQYGGDLFISANSSVLLFDPVSPSTSRNVSLVGGASGTDNLAALTVWGADCTLTVDAGATTGGIFTIARTGGATSVPGNSTLHLTSGATVHLSGSEDALSNGTNHVNVSKDAGATFGVLQGNKNIGALSGSGSTSILGTTALTVHQNTNTTTGAILGLGAFVKEGSGTLTSNLVGVGALTVNAGTLDVGSLDPVATGKTITVAGGALVAPSVIDNGVVTVSAGSLTTDLLAVGNDGTLTAGTGVGTATVSGGVISAKKVLLGSSAGGDGTLRVQVGGTLVSEGVVSNALVVNGGTVTISAPAVPSDPVTDGSLVAGFVHDGSMNLNFGSITTPKVKLGVTAGKTGQLILNGGTLNVTTLGVGNDATATGGTGTGALIVNGGQVNATALIIGSSAGGIGEMTLGSGNPDKTLKVATLTINTTGLNKLDLTDNKLIVTAGAVGTANGDVYTGLSGLIQNAFSDGAWVGPGITTTQADALTGLTGLGIATADQTGYAGGMFGGVTVAATDVLVMYTYGGDANLDGFISGDDYAAIDFSIAVPGSFGWVNGDFNWDGIISGDDYAAIDFNIVAQGAPFPVAGTAGLSEVVAVPEPCGFAAAAVVALLAPVAGRRRRAQTVEWQRSRRERGRMS